MLYRFKGILMLFLMAILWVACEPEEEEPDPEPALPPITQHGANTLGCYINGFLWLPDGRFGFPKLVADYHPYRPESDSSYWYTLQIQTNRVRKHDRWEGGIVMGHKYVIDTGYYPLCQPDSLAFRYSGHVRYLDDYYFNEYKSFPSPNNWLHIHKLDIHNRIISGTFQFDAVNEDNNKDTVRVRDGRFDIRFTY